MGIGFAPTWLRQVSPLLHKTTLTTGYWLRQKYIKKTGHSAIADKPRHALMCSMQRSDCPLKHTNMPNMLPSAEFGCSTSTGVSTSRKKTQ